MKANSPEPAFTAQNAVKVHNSKTELIITQLISVACQLLPVTEQGLSMG
jgi:hypothetical protein